MTQPTTKGRADVRQLRAEERRRRRAVERLPSVLRTAVTLVREASPRLAVVLTALQVVVATSAVLQLIALRETLTVILDGDGGLSSRLITPLTALVLLLAVSGAVTVVLTQWRRLLGERVTRRVFDRILDVTTKVDLEEFERPEFFNQLQRVLANSAFRPLTLTQGLVDLLTSVVTTLALAGVLLALHPYLVLLLLLPAAPLVLLSRRASRAEFRFTVEQARDLRRRTYLASLMTQAEPAKEVRAFGLAGALRSRHDDLYDLHEASVTGLVRTRVVLGVASSALSSLIIAVTILVLVVLVRRGSVSLAEAGAGAVTIRLLGSRVEQVFSAAGALLESTLFLDDLETFLRLAREPTLPDDGTPLPELREMHFDRVSYRYPGSEEPALKDVELTVKRGEVIALVGENGSGKTTLAKIAAGLLRPSAGSLWWNGDRLPPASSSHRAQVAVVFQDFLRFELPAQDNIALGRPEVAVDFQRVRAAAQKVDIDALLNGLSEGYETYLSKAYDGGRDLSGGQWQRVALARALYRDAPLLILDEPSAALDPRAEKALFDSLRSVLDGRTAMIISHRFSTVRSADCIHVLQGGSIVESGTHDELMALAGLYAELFRLQAVAYAPSTMDEE